MRMCVQLAAACGAIAISCVNTVAQPNVGEPNAPAQTDVVVKKPVTLRVVNSDGTPARRALAATFANKEAGSKASEPFTLSLSGVDTAKMNTTDDRGVIEVPAACIFTRDPSLQERALLVMTSDAKHMAIVRISSQSLGSTFDVVLRPACKVTVKLTSKDLESRGKASPWTNVYVYLEAVKNSGMRFMGVSSENGSHELYLPPGEYELRAYGTDTYTADPSPRITIVSGDTEKSMSVDLPASRLALITGTPAPEFVKIKAWQNAAAAGGTDEKGVTLASLRGKIVLLDFWGHWCGPCVHAMPGLMELHEKYKDKGLVIIAVHDDSVASIAEMNEKLTEIRKTVWGGRDLPFAIALDGGGETPIPGHFDSVRGATTALYGIKSWPTQIIIDRDGKIVGRRLKGERDQLKGMLEK